MFENSLQLVATALASVVYWFDRFMSSFPLFISLFASFFVMYKATQMLALKLGMQRSEAVRKDLMAKENSKQPYDEIRRKRMWEDNERARKERWKFNERARRKG